MDIKLNRTALANLALQSEGVRNLVEEEGMRRVRTLSAAIGADKVDYGGRGISRARFTIRRLESLQKEAADGRLSRLINGGG